MSNLKQLKATIDKMISDAGASWETVPVAYALWTAEDIETERNESFPDEVLTDGDVSEILDEVYHNQDCGNGITWSVINDVIRWRLQDRKLPHNII